MDAARDKLIQDHLGYVRGIAGQVLRSLSSNLDFDELVAYGSQGLVEAANKFDASRGVAFTTFSYYRIRGAIFDGLRQSGWLKRNEYARFQAASNDYLENQAARSSSPNPNSPSSSTEETVKALTNTIEDLATIFVTSIEALPGLQVADEKATDSLGTVAKKETSLLLKKALENLPDKERQLIEHYYFHELTLEEAGSQLGLSKSWASRLHARAIRLLGETLEKLQYDDL